MHMFIQQQNNLIKDAKMTKTHTSKNTNDQQIFENMFKITKH